MGDRFSESHLRTITKTVAWRIIATLITFLVVYFFEGEISKSIGISGVVAVFLIIGYYLNERVWNQVEWGRKIRTIARSKRSN